jgi:hypothetical protein
MSRNDLLACFRSAGYHNDQKSFTRLFCGNRINKQTANEQFNIGVQQRMSGTACSCYECTKKATP